MNMRIKSGSKERLFKLANELYYRTKGKTFVSGSKAMYGETTEAGRRITLVELYRITKAIGINSFIELGLMETENGKKYTASSMVRWIGGAPTMQTAIDLKEWNRNYSRKKNEEKAIVAQSKAVLTQGKLELDTPTSETQTIATKSEIYETFAGDQTKEKEDNTTFSESAEPVDGESVLQRLVHVEEKRNEILTSLLIEFKKLNGAILILGPEYSRK